MGRIRRADDAIEAPTTADDVHTSRPDPVVLPAVRAWRVNPDRAICGRDSIRDVRSSRAAGIACVGVETGGFSHHGLSEPGVRRGYRGIREIWRQFHTSPRATLIPACHTER